MIAGAAVALTLLFFIFARVISVLYPGAEDANYGIKLPYVEQRYDNSDK